MARPTLASLRARVLDLVDMTSSSFPVTARVNEYINDGLAKIHNHLVQTGHHYVFSTSTINVVAGTESYALPADLLKLVDIFVVESGYRYMIPLYKLEDLHGRRTAPTTPATVEVWYSKQFDPLAADGTEVHESVATGWEDFAVYHAAIMLLSREESDTTSLKQERQAAWTLILDQATPRDEHESFEIEDVSHRFDRHPGSGPTVNLAYRMLNKKIFFLEM